MKEFCLQKRVLSPPLCCRLQRKANVFHPMEHINLPVLGARLQQRILTLLITPTPSAPLAQHCMAGVWNPFLCFNPGHHNRPQSKNLPKSHNTLPDNWTGNLSHHRLSALNTSVWYQCRSETSLFNLVTLLSNYTL